MAKDTPPERERRNPFPSARVPDVKARTIRFPDSLWERIAEAADKDGQDAASWLRETAVERLAGRQRTNDMGRLDDVEQRLTMFEAELLRRVNELADRVTALEGPESP